MQTELKDPPLAPLEAEMVRLRALFDAGQFQEAREAAQSLLLQLPRDRDLLYLLAASQRRTRRIAEAFQTLKLLKDAYPRYGRLFQELGFCYLAENAVTPAIQVFERAVALNTCLIDSWKTLQGLYRTRGAQAASEAAGDQAQQLSALPEPIRLACEKYFDGETRLAEELVRGYLSVHCEHIEALRLLAKIAGDAGAEYDAELMLQRAVLLAPASANARRELVQLLLTRHKHIEARTIAAELMREHPQEPAFQRLFAAAAAGMGDYDTALPIFKELLQRTPDDPQLLLAYANALKTIGEITEAIACLQHLAAQPGACAEGLWSLSDLKTYVFSDQELSQLQRLTRSPGLQRTERYQACFALGKALEDRADYAEAFRNYEHGNRLKRSSVRYRAEVLERVAEQQRKLCDRDFFAARRGFGDASNAPIFIVGLPRSGSTLIEQILASHSQIEGTMELPHIPRMVLELRRSAQLTAAVQTGASQAGAAVPTAPAVGAYTQILERLDASSCQALGAQYLRGTAPYRRSAGTHFTDKMPNNFRHLDFIQLILPNARIIDVRREPMACCFSIYRQLFAQGQRFAYSMEEIARYYRMYVDLMEHWDAVCPGRILRVQYEEVIEQLEPSVRRLLEFCGLQFEPQCLQFHRTRRAVHSASAAQVQQPLYREGREHWRHFEPWLQPLRQALGPLATAAR